MDDQETEPIDITQLLEEPEGFRIEPPIETFTSFYRDPSKEPNEVSIRLVGKHALWAHCLWNAGKVISNYFDGNLIQANNNKNFPNGDERMNTIQKVDYVGENLPTFDVKSKNVLEMGGGAALPSLVAAMNGASKVVITDYPDEPLLENISRNVEKNVPGSLNHSVFVRGFLWGKDVSPLLACLPPGEKFHVIILSDLLFNHSVHTELIESCKQCLDPQGKIIVAFSHHRPKYEAADLAFFTKAKEQNFKVSKLFTQRVGPMFPEDPGSLEVRATVSLYEISF